MSSPKFYYTTPPYTEALPQCMYLPDIYKGHARPVPMEEIFRLIQSSPELEAATGRCRSLLAQGDEKGYAQAKARQGAYIPAILCEGGRKRENITALTGIGMVDFDHLADQDRVAALEKVAQDPHTLMAYTTTSGRGLRVLFRYTARTPETAYADAWRWGNEYYAMLTGLAYDEAAKDPTRLSFLCHDPDVRLNPQAVPFLIQSGEEAQEALRNLPPDTPKGTECARVAADIANRHCPFNEGSRHRNLIYRAFLMNKMGCCEADIADGIAPDCPRGDKEARDIARWVHQHGSTDFGTWKEAHLARHDVRKRPLAECVSDTPAKSNALSKCASPEEIKAFLAAHSLSRYNTLSGLVEVWSDEDQAFVAINDRTVNSLWQQCIAALGRYVKPLDFDRVFNSDAVPPFDPVAAFLGSLPEWDGTDHIKALAGHVTTASDPEIFEYCFRQWFVSMVASWIDPKVMNQNILTLIGAQGLFKSTFFRMLLPPELAPYFLAKGNSTYVSKDDKLAVSSHCLIDFEEIDSMKDADLNAIKALVTTEKISERAAYARNRENRPHLASFCATGNNKMFLTDLTGNRRWLPFEVESIQNPYDHPIDYPQLYAHALALIRQGCRYWITRDEDLRLEPHKAQFTEPCIEEELLNKYYRLPNELELGTFLTNTEILARCSLDLRGQLSAKRMGAALKKLGYRTKTIRGRHGYILIERTFEEINSEKADLVLALNREERAKNPTKC